MIPPPSTNSDSTAAVAPPAPSQKLAYELKITLLHSKPPIWRRVRVADTTTLEDMHAIIRDCFGWLDQHMYQFNIPGNNNGEVNSWECPPILLMTNSNEWPVTKHSKIRLNQVIQAKENFKFAYNYDIGCAWQHVIQIERIFDREPGALYPTCVDGQGASVPEDCGGLPAYYAMVEAAQQPNHPRHNQALDWGFDENFNPNAFDAAAVNALWTRA